MHGVLPELPWNTELDSSQDIFAGHGLSHVELSDIKSDLSVDLEKDRIHHVHGILANAGFLWLILLQDSEQVRLKVLKTVLLLDLLSGNHTSWSPSSSLGIGLVLVGSSVGSNSFWHWRCFDCF